ncbi:MAG: hypothetical protein JOZ18_18970 [Chloroflexi bacterium]|nr:hypothetical protein [Chloroflexota bacterium]
MTNLLSLRQCAKYLGIPTSTFEYYRMRMAEDFPTMQVGPAKLVDPDIVRRKLIEAGYRFKASAPEA